VHHLSYPAQITFAFLDGEPLQIYAFIIVFTGACSIPIRCPLFLSATPIGSAARCVLPGIVDFIVMSPLFFQMAARTRRKAKTTSESQLLRGRGEGVGEKRMAGVQVLPHLAD